MPHSYSVPYNQLPLIGQMGMCLIWAYLIYFILDTSWRKSLLEKVEVRECRFIPEQRRLPGRHTMSYQAPTWILLVANERGQGTVKVSEEFYNAVHEGATLYVQGKQGRLSGRWFLREASKKPPKKR